jgi:ubiquitin-conjugating enzyme E2 D/E
MKKGGAIVNRIMKEIHEMKTSPPENCSAGPDNDSNIMLWKATIIGPPASPFENGIFMLTIEFPIDYPFKPPNIKFNTPVYHPNINKRTGAICLDILKTEWSPALTISKVLLSICSLLTDPNPKDPYEPEVAKLYMENKNKYEMVARQWTTQYASGFSDNSNNSNNKFKNNETRSDDTDEDDEDDDDEEDDGSMEKVD